MGEGGAAHGWEGWEGWEGCEDGPVRANPNPLLLKLAAEWKWCWRKISVLAYDVN